MLLGLRLDSQPCPRTARFGGLVSDCVSRMGASHHAVCFGQEKTKALPRCWVLGPERFAVKATKDCGLGAGLGRKTQDILDPWHLLLCSLILVLSSQLAVHMSLLQAAAISVSTSLSAEPTSSTSVSFVYDLNLVSGRSPRF